MRDLQQAFVQDNESPDNLDLNCLNFDPNKKAVTDANLLDLLKQPNPNPELDPDSGHGTDPGPSPGQISVEQRASKSVRKSGGQIGSQKGPKKPYLVSDSSSCGGYESAESLEKDIIVLAAEHIQAYDDNEKNNKYSSEKNQHFSKKSTSSSSNNAVKSIPNENTKTVKQKKSFWQKLTANLKGSSSSSS